MTYRHDSAEQVPVKGGVRWKDSSIAQELYGAERSDAKFAWP